jgi:hypothetical protein
MRIEKPVDAVARFHVAAVLIATPETEAASTMSKTELKRCNKRE